MALPPEKTEPLRDKLKRAKERRMADLLKKLHKDDNVDDGENPLLTMEQRRIKEIRKRIIGSTKETLETTSAQQKIDPVITTKEVAVTTEIDQGINLTSSTMLLPDVEDKTIQTLIPGKIYRSKCSNCCGGLPGRGPGLGQGCERRCSCIPGLQIRETGFCDEERFPQNSTDKIQLSRLFVTRNQDNRLRGGGGLLGQDSRKTKMPRICCLQEKNPSLPTQCSLRRRKLEGSTIEDKEHRLPRRFHRSLSSPRGQLARWKEAHESYLESCLRGGRSRSGKNCVGHRSISVECVPTSSYDIVSEAPPRISERSRKFRRKQNVMAAAAAAATVGWTSRSNKLWQGTTTSPLLALSATSKCFRKGLVDLVGNKYHEYFPWETPSFDERKWSFSSFRKDSKLFSMLESTTSRKRRNDCPDGYSLSTESDKTISSTSDVRLRSSTRNRFYFPLEIMIRVRHSKSCRNYNFSQQRGYPLRRVLKLERNDQERLRGGGSTLDIITKRKLQRETNSKDRLTMDHLDDTVIRPVYKNKENNVTGVRFSENKTDDECSWSHDLTNERMQRFQEDQGYRGDSEDRNEDGRIRGGCGGSYKPVQHSYFSNASTILGRRNLQHPRSPCCPPARPQVSCRPASAGRSPCCQRSSPVCCPTRFQNQVSCGRIDPCNDTPGCCACNTCGGAACNDNSNIADVVRCCRPQQRVQHACQCKCQTNKGFRSCGGCGGQSCGSIYSCSGAGGGTCCFPRNTERRTGPECCGGGNSNCGGCC